MRRIGVVAGSGAGVATRRLIGTTPTDFGSKPVSTSGVKKPPLADPTGGAGLIGKMFADPEPNDHRCRCYCNHRPNSSSDTSPDDGHTGATRRLRAAVQRHP